MIDKRFRRGYAIHRSDTQSWFTAYDVRIEENQMSYITAANQVKKHFGRLITINATNILFTSRKVIFTIRRNSF